MKSPVFPRLALASCTPVGIAAAFLMIASPAEAAVTTLQLDWTKDPSLTPGGSAPWITATFTDMAPVAGVNVVRLSLDTSNLVKSVDVEEFITRFYFNLDPSFTNSVSWTVINPAGFITIDHDEDSLGGGQPLKGFDFELAMPTKKADRIIKNDPVIVDFKGIDLTASLFEAVTDDDFLAAAHIQGLSEPDPRNSVWIGDLAPNISPIPETSSSLSVAMILSAGLSFRARRRR
ncbi:hypothetical protein [Luteolibacter luteus]|uniref:PEP-CTERM sorting domain-containing protein n=1 Tax=Luteolibacter luteus TaxID=2728835 RepID=A0A858RPZ6_9BACT|nr:hypothetical protein [Luteolibacter luteus]QJE98003.1 hypothetical protein HHL09_20160 [Luteolibacter luteus]